MKFIIMLPSPTYNHKYKKAYKTMILSVLYGCGTWSLALRKEHRLSVSGEKSVEGNVLT